MAPSCSGRPDGPRPRRTAAIPQRGLGAGSTSGCSAASLSAEQAPAHFGFLGAFLGADSPASSSLTRTRFGWQPVQPGLIEDLEQGHYFEVAPIASASA